jgi:peptide/nickel transport system substrate-binding protein
MFKKIIFTSLIVIFTLASHSNANDQVLRMAFDSGDMRTLDPHYSSANVDRAVVDMIFNSLVRLKPGNARMDLIEPDLAESWKISSDYKTWTFYLRKKVMFHPFKSNPSYELTADDVVFSLEKASDNKRSAYASSFNDISFRKVDNYTIEITSKGPVSPALFISKLINYGGGYIVSRRAVEELGMEGFRIHPVGTGPFMMKEYKPKEKLVLQGFKDHFRGTPILKLVEMLYIPDLSARNIGLRNREIDLIEGPMEESWVKLMRSYPKIVVDVFGPGSTSVLHFNMSKPPFNDKRVRQAVAYAISRDELVASIGSSVAEILYSPLPGKYMVGGLNKEEVAANNLIYDYNPERSRSLLKEAGYLNGLSVDVIHTEMATMLRPIESIQAQLKKVGIILNLKIVDHSTFHSLIRKDASQMVHYMAWRPTADEFLTRYYHSISTVVTGSKPDTNFSHFQLVDELIDTARQQTDLQKQIELWKLVQLKVLEELPAFPLFIKKFTLARGEYVDYGCDLESSVGFYAPIRENSKIKLTK